MSKRLAAIATPLLATAALFAACSTSNVSATAPATQTGADASDDADASRPAVCDPGAPVPCVCAGGGYGTATCSDAGTSFGLCLGCPLSDASAADVTTTVPDDSGPPSDGSAPTDAAPTPDAGDSSVTVPASLVFAHAAPGVPPVRLCLSTSNAAGALAVAPIPAIPDAPSHAPAVPAMGIYPAVAAGTPGVYPGTIGALPVIADFSSLNLTFIAVLSSSTASDINFDGGAGVGPDGGSEEDCVTLLGTHALGPGDTAPGSVQGRLQPGVDFFILPTIPAGTLLASSTYLLSLTGCLAGAEGSGAATCGAGDGGTNAQVGVAPLDTTAVAAGVFGVQFAHRSSALEGTAYAQAGQSAHGPASLGVVAEVLSVGNTPLTVGTVTSFSSNAVAPTPAAALAIDPTVAGTSFGVLLAPVDGGTPSSAPYPTGDLFSLPLADIAVLSDWGASTATAPASFAKGSAYTFLLVGDPAAPPLAFTPDDGGPATANPAYDGRGLHFVAFPNRFSPKPF